MELSLFLGKLFGLYLIIVGIALVRRRQIFQIAVNDFMKSPGLILFSGAIATVIGLLIVLSHNVWEMSWRVVITLLGYIALFKGITRIYFLEVGHAQWQKLFHSNGCLYLGVVLFILGLYLTYHGFVFS